MVEQLHPSGLYRQLIPYPIYRLYFQVGAMLLELFSQIFNLGVDKIKIVGIVNMVSPHVFRQRRFMDKTVLINDKKRHNIKLLSVEPYILSTNLQGAIVEIQFHIIDSNEVSTVKCLATKHGPNAGIQLRQVKWFSKVIVGAQVQARKLVIEGILCRDDDDIHPLIR